MFRLKDTFDLRHKLKDSSKDNLGLSESGGEITELTQREEYKMTSAFRVIQGRSSNHDNSRFKAPEDRISIGGDSVEDETTNNGLAMQGPSTDFYQHIDRLTKPKTTAEWEPEGIEMETITSGRVLNPIPITTRESTPDSVVSTGVLNLRRTQTTGFGPKVNFSTVQENFRPPENDNERQTEVNRPYEMEDPPPQGQGMEDARPGHGVFEGTMRDQLRNKKVDETDGEKPVQGNGDSKKNDPYESYLEKGVRCWPRAILMFFLVGILLAGLICAIVFIEPEDPTGTLGTVHPDPITHAECLNVTLRLNETFQINCTFDINHPERRNLINSSVQVIPPYQSSSVNKLDAPVPPSNGIMLWQISGTKATCLSAGVYTLNFTNGNKPILNISVTVSVKSQYDDIVTAIKQVRIPKTLNETKFDVNCSMSGDCNAYTVEFFGRRGKEDILDGNKTCSFTSNDKTGYIINCTGSFSEETVRKYTYLGCRMKSLNDHVIQKEFKLPECSNDCEADDNRPYNCSLRSKTREALDNCSREYFGRCFDRERSTFSYKVCSYGNNCSEDLKNTRCRLMWCRIRVGARSKLVESMDPGTLLCPDSYREITKTTLFPVPSTNPTTNPTTDSNNTSSINSTESSDT